MTEKYVILDPFPAGFTNVLMSYEIAFAISYITNRSIILPPTSWCVLIDERDAKKESWQDIWTVCDKNYAREEFKIYDLLEFKKLSRYLKKETDNYSWLSGDISSSKNIYDLVDSNICCFNGTNINQDDLDKFASGRPVRDINYEDEFLRVTAFGHYWYNVYAPSPSDRNKMKQKVNKALKYKKVYYEIASSAMQVEYNAVHIRNPNQLNYDEYSDVAIFKNKPEVVLNQIKQLYNNDKPLYVATDIDNKSIFNLLEKSYDLIFYEDLKLPKLTPLEKIAVDQIICSNAQIFYGSYYSTFSKRINIMRGLEGKQSNDYMGFNKIIDEPITYTNPIPWQSKHWDWHESSHCQWMKE